MKTYTIGIAIVGVFLTCIFLRLNGSVELRLERITICRSPKIVDNHSVHRRKRKRLEMLLNILD